MAKVRGIQFLDVNCEVRQPFSFRKRSATPDFGLSEESTGAEKPGTSPQPSDYIDSKAASGLSSIHTSVDSPKLQEESRDIIGLLQAGGAGESSVRLSPVAQQKMYSRLDESSIVDPSTQVLVDDSLDKLLKREVSRLLTLLTEDRETFKVMLRNQSADFEERLHDIHTALSTSQRLREDAVCKLQSGLKDTAVTDKENRFELITELQKDLESKDKSQMVAANQRLTAVKRDYEARLQQQTEQLRVMKQQNVQLKAQLDDAVARSALQKPTSEERQALEEENEVLRKRLEEVKRTLACPRCTSGRGNRRG